MGTKTIRVSKREADGTLTAQVYDGAPGELDALRAVVQTLEKRLDEKSRMLEGVAKPRAYADMTPAERAFVDEEHKSTLKMFDDDERMTNLLNEFKDVADIGGHIAALDGLAAMVRKYVPVLLERVAELEQRVAKAELRGIDYKGTYQRAIEYRRGDATTHRGDLWIALIANPSTAPGDGAAWQLAVPGGRAR